MSDNHSTKSVKMGPLDWLIHNPIKSIIIIYFVFYYIWYITGGPVQDSRKKPYIGPTVVNGNLRFNYYNDLKFR